MVLEKSPDIENIIPRAKLATMKASDPRWFLANLQMFI